MLPVFLSRYIIFQVPSSFWTIVKTEPLYAIPFETFSSWVQLLPVIGTQNVFGLPFGVRSKDHLPCKLTVITIKEPSSNPCSAIFSP